VNFVAAIPRAGLQTWTQAVQMRDQENRSVAEAPLDKHLIVVTAPVNDAAAPKTGTAKFLSNAGLPSIPIAVCLHLDDSDTTSSEYKLAWRRFWSAANLLQYLPEFMPTSRTGIEARRYAPIIDAAESLSKDAAVRWVQTDTVEPGSSDYADTDETTELLDELLEFTDWPNELQALIQAGVVLPDEVGLDINLDGMVHTVMEWAWESARVGYLASDDAELQTRLTEAGWRIVTRADAAARTQLADWLQQES